MPAPTDKRPLFGGKPIDPDDPRIKWDEAEECWVRNPDSVDAAEVPEKQDRFVRGEKKGQLKWKDMPPEKPTPPGGYVAHNGYSADGKPCFAPRTLMEINGMTIGGMSDAVNDLIEAAAQDHQATIPPRSYLGGSEIGGPCIRQIAYDFFQRNEAIRNMQAQADQMERSGISMPPRNNTQKAFPGHVLRIFKAGHHLEDEMVADLRSAGFAIDTGPAEGRQHGFSSMGGRFRGHLDGVVTLSPISAVRTPCLFEAKSLNDKGWNQCNNDGVKKSHPKYYSQMQLYMHMKGLTANPGLLGTINKNNSKYAWQLVEYDHDEVERLLVRAEMILKSERPEDLPREGKQGGYPCMFCDHSSRCWAESDMATDVMIAPDWMK